MIELVAQISRLLADYAPVASSLAILLPLVLLLSKSIKRYKKRYYLVFLLLTIGVMILPATGISFRSLRDIAPVWSFLRFYTTMDGFGYPLLILIMYAGALPAGLHVTKKLMSIRQELSIISGFPILCHATLRIIHIIPSTFKFFFAGERQEMMHGMQTNLTANILSHSAFMLGIFMTILFLVLWITSFSRIHRALGGKRWKAIQRWSYGLYAMIFCHSVLINAGQAIMCYLSDVTYLNHLIGILTTVVIFASYLYIRLKKARRDRLRRQSALTIQH